MRRFTTAAAIALPVLAADQASKLYILETLRLHETPPVELLPFFNLAFVWNRGISFGMFASYDRPMILLLMNLVILAILLVWLSRTPHRLTALALGAVMGGALGNMIDRLRFGAVADFLDFHLGSLHWPAFNLADSAIFIGVVLLCAEGMFTGRNSPKDPSP